jgi:hypothetical protein
MKTRFPPFLGGRIFRFVGFSGKVCKSGSFFVPVSRLDKLLDLRFGELPLVHFLAIVLDHFVGRMAGNGLHFVGGAARF